MVIDFGRQSATGGSKGGGRGHGLPRRVGKHPECTKSRHFQTQIEKFSGEGAMPLPQTPPAWGGGYSLPKPQWSTPKNQFWSGNRRFQAKLAKSKNVHIIKTTALIPTTFCRVIKTTKCPSWLVRTHASQIQDGGRPPSLKSKNRHISAAVSAISTKFGMATQFDPLDRSDHYEFKILKNPGWRRPPSWKIPKSRYLSNGLTDRHEIWHSYAYSTSEQVRQLKFPTFTNQRWRTATVLKNWKT